MSLGASSQFTSIFDADGISAHIVDDPPCGDVANPKGKDGKCTSELKGGGAITVNIEKT